jgi:protocatechuate 3,4-dioxygenase beta subunit
MSPRKTHSYLFVVLFVLTTVFALGQTVTSGTVVGSVADSTGAAVTSAIVTITQADTGAVRTVKTNDSGQYRFPFVKPGDYTISAKSAGLTAEVSHFSLMVGQEQQINLVLAVQSVQQSVYVNSSASLLET